MAADAGPHTIVFNIPGSGVQTIAVASNLPMASVPGGLTIDGTTQPGYAGTPLIALVCANTNVFAFNFTSAGTVLGLSIGGCGAGVLAGSGGGPITVKSSYLGVGPDGTTPVPNNAGISLSHVTFTIGGAPADRNIISGNTSYGIFIGPSPAARSRTTTSAPTSRVRSRDRTTSASACWAGREQPGC